MEESKKKTIYIRKNSINIFISVDVNYFSFMPFCIGWVENFDEIGEGKIFGKLQSTFLRYPVGRKFRRNRSISHGLGDMSTFAFFSIQNS